jgi:hypothetical protein
VTERFVLQETATALTTGVDELRAVESLIASVTNTTIVHVRSIAVAYTILTLAGFVTSFAVIETATCCRQYGPRR